MGHNFFFAFTVVVARGTPWPVALGAVAIAGSIFILTAGVGLRERVITAVPESLKHAIGVGIGLLIALIGLEWSGIIVASPGTFVTLGQLTIAAGAARARHAGGDGRADGARRQGRDAHRHAGVDRRRGWLLGLVHVRRRRQRAAVARADLLKLDMPGALKPALIDVVFVFFFLALFDSIGTLIGVAGRIGLVSDGTLPRARQALLADAIGTVVGAVLGTSTVTAYVESSTGVSAGGRTGLASVVTAALFLVALFFYPLVR